MATDWSRYETGFTSLEITGIRTQPGYIAMFDETNALIGFLYAHSDGNLYWSKRAAQAGLGHTAVDLTTTKLGTHGGEIKVNNL